MKKFVVIGLICLMGCTSVDTYKCKRDLENYKIKTDGNLNGFAINDNEIIEGRTKGANYKRLLISNGKKKVMTRLAYDCSESKHSDCYAIHIWEHFYGANLYISIEELVGLYDRRGYVDPNIWLSVFPSYDDDTNFESFTFYCNLVHIKIKAVKLLNKKEADELLAAHPEVNVFKDC